MNKRQLIDWGCEGRKAFHSKYPSLTPEFWSQESTVSHVICGELAPQVLTGSASKNTRVNPKETVLCFQVTSESLPVAFKPSLGYLKISNVTQSSANNYYTIEFGESWQEKDAHAPNRRNFLKEYLDPWLVACGVQILRVSCTSSMETMLSCKRHGWGTEEWEPPVLMAQARLCTRFHLSYDFYLRALSPFCHMISHLRTE